MTVVNLDGSSNYRSLDIAVCFELISNTRFFVALEGIRWQ